MKIKIEDYQNDIRAKALTTYIAGMGPDDILQEINLQLLRAESRYDPMKSSPRTFISRVATNKIRDLIRRSRAKKRNYQDAVSLDQLFELGFDISDQSNEIILQNY